MPKVTFKNLRKNDVRIKIVANPDEINHISYPPNYREDIPTLYPHEGLPGFDLCLGPRVDEIPIGKFSFSNPLVNNSEEIDGDFKYKITTVNSMGEIKIDEGLEETFDALTITLFRKGIEFVPHMGMENPGFVFVNKRGSGHTINLMIRFPQDFASPSPDHWHNEGTFENNTLNVNLFPAPISNKITKQPYATIFAHPDTEKVLPLVGGIPLDNVGIAHQTLSEISGSDGSQGNISILTFDLDGDSTQQYPLSIINSSDYQTLLGTNSLGPKINYLKPKRLEPEIGGLTIVLDETSSIGFPPTMKSNSIKLAKPIPIAILIQDFGEVCTFVNAENLQGEIKCNWGGSVRSIVGFNGSVLSLNNPTNINGDIENPGFGGVTALPYWGESESDIPQGFYLITTLNEIGMPDDTGESIVDINVEITSTLPISFVQPSTIQVTFIFETESEV